MPHAALRSAQAAIELEHSVAAAELLAHHTVAHTSSCTPACALNAPLPELQMHALSLRGNQLTGPAFPPSWLQQGALVILILSGNHGLTGTLPASLPWPYFNEL